MCFQDVFVGSIALGRSAVEEHNSGSTWIYIVEDDLEVRQSLSFTLSRAGYQMSCFEDGPSLIDATLTIVPACILLDIRLPGASGLHILQTLRERGDLAPVIMVSGVKEIETAVEALKLGAVDYIEKPFSVADLLARVHGAISAFSASNEAPRFPSNFPGHELLSRRELEVLNHAAKGASAKEIAIALKLSPRTVEDYRASLLRKMSARNIPELMLRIMTAAQNRHG